MGGAYIGLDIGGQTIKGIRVEPDGAISSHSSSRTPAGSSREVVLEVVARVLGGLLAGGPVAAVGSGTPGGVDGEGNIVGIAANIPGWAGTPLAASLSAIAQAPAYVRNDGNTAAYAEWAARAGSRGRASKAFLFVGLGTGIGGGYIEDGAILSGTDDKALEVGHIIVHPGGRECSCGRRGCAEAYASGPSIGRIAMDLAPGFDSPLSRAARGGATLNAREVYEAFESGDALAQAAHSAAVEALARAMGTAIALLAPELIVLGGGVIAGARSLVADVEARSADFVFAAARRGVRFEAAMLGPEAGMLGAALYAASRVAGREEVLALAAAAAPGIGFSPRRA